MSNFSDYLELQLLGHTLLGSTLTAPAQTFATLCTSINSDAISITEVLSGLGYDRQPIAWTAPLSGPDWAVQNAAPIPFAQATTPWGSVTQVAITDSATIGTGNVLYWVDLSPARAVPGGDVLQISSGQLTVRLA